MHGIDGDQRLGQAEFAEQGLHRRNLVRLVVAVQMRQHQPGVRREGAQDMGRLAVVEVIEAVAQRFAVDVASS